MSQAQQETDHAADTEQYPTDHEAVTTNESHATSAHPVPPASAPTYPRATPAVSASPGPRAITSLVLGIVSLVAGWTFVAPIIGLVFGFLARSHEGQESRTMSTWALVLNGVALLGWVIGIIGAIAFTLATFAFLPFALF